MYVWKFSFVLSIRLLWVIANELFFKHTTMWYYHIWWAWLDLQDLLSKEIQIQICYQHKCQPMFQKPWPGGARGVRILALWSRLVLAPQWPRIISIINCIIFTDTTIVITKIKITKTNNKENIKKLSKLYYLLVGGCQPILLSLAHIVTLS